MNLQLAKEKVRKAVETHNFAVKENLPVTSNYTASAYRGCIQKLPLQEADKFSNWYDEYVTNNKMVQTKQA